MAISDNKCVTKETIEQLCFFIIIIIVIILSSEVNSVLSTWIKIVPA